MNVIKQALRRLARWMLAHVRPQDDEIDQALQHAFVTCGLAQDLYTREFDLLHSGKLHEVLIHAASELGNPLVTVDDLRRLLR